MHFAVCLHTNVGKILFNILIQFIFLYGLSLILECSSGNGARASTSKYVFAVISYCPVNSVCQR